MPDLNFYLDPTTQLVRVEIDPKCKRKFELRQMMQYHPWFSEQDQAEIKKVAKVDVAMAMIAKYAQNTSIGINKPLQDYYAAVKKAQADRLALLQNVQLWPYQLEGAKRLISARRALLADEMGLGKTLQVIAALRPGDGVTVICPASVKGHWRAEIAKARPDFTTHIHSGYQEAWDWPGPGEVHIYNPQILPEAPSEADNFDAEEQSPFHPPPPNRQTVIVDEAHYAKNSRGAMHTRTVAITAPAYRAGGNVYAVTATPLLNKPTDLWGVLGVAQLSRDTFGNFGKFCHAFNGKKGAHGMYWGKAQPYVADLLELTVIRRRKADVLSQLPPKIYRTLYVAREEDDSPQAWDRVKKANDPELLAEVKATPTVAAALASYRALSAETKITALLELVEDYEAAKEPVVVFSAHRAPIDALAARDGWIVITGDTPAFARSEFVKRFQDGLYKGIGLTIAAGGTGITLTRAQHVVFVDRDWTPALNEQAEDRLHRIGQEGSVVVTDLVYRDAVDARVHELCTQKVDVLASAGLDFSMGRKGSE